MPKNFREFISEREFISDMDKTGNYIPGDSRDEIEMGGNVWELRVYHSFKDSIVLRKNYEGNFQWDGSKVRQDNFIELVKPVIKEDN